MTDQIIPPEGPSGPPVIISNPPVGSIIKFNRLESNELRIRLKVRNENTAETLRVRFQLDTGQIPPAHPHDFPCPEDVVIPGSPGELIREEVPLVISNAKIARNACTRLQVAVSASFISCELPGVEFDVTETFKDDDGHRALATYTIFETSEDPYVNLESALRVVTTCPLPAMTTDMPTRAE